MQNLVCRIITCTVTSFSWTMMSCKWSVILSLGSDTLKNLNSKFSPRPTLREISTCPAMVKLSSTMKGMRWTWWDFETTWHVGSQPCTALGGCWLAGGRWCHASSSFPPPGWMSFSVLMRCRWKHLDSRFLPLLAPGVADPEKQDSQNCHILLENHNHRNC